MGGTALPELGSPDPGSSLDAAGRQRFLADVAATLFSSLDYPAIVDRLAELAVPRVADGCVIYVREVEGTARVEAEAYVEGAQRSSPAGSRVDQVLDTGQPLVEPDLLVVPLSGQRGCVGALALVSAASGRKFGDDEVALALELGRRTATVIDAAGVLREAGRAAERVALQNEVGRVLAESVDE
jgi:GAF domain-containing protein